MAPPELGDHPYPQGAIVCAEQLLHTATLAVPIEGPAPTVTGALTTWTFSPVADILIAVAAMGYGWMVMRAHRRSEHWPVIRIASWYAGLACLVLALDSALATYSHRLFTIHMVVHLLMIAVVPALMVWGQPIRLLHLTGGPRARAIIDAARLRSPWRWLIAARFTVPLYAAVLVLTHLTGFQQAMLTHAWVHTAELLLYLISGYLLLLPLVGGELTTEPAWPYGLRLLVLAICVGPDTLVGVTLMMSSTVLAPAYAASRAWGPGALTDQNTAGVIMWLGGDGLMVVLMIIVAGQWVRAGDQARSFGPWLDGIRQRALLGESTSGGDIDAEQAALDAYNTRLAQLHGRRPVPRRDDKDGNPA
ncbi:cytochrome c oxidase assembly protein [Nocardia sp. NEAU-G5]|uniref:Cytochrome c oxidase assembly protein n=1 Tax=Nocardia albiluteola TaxID=2842303 RepID=A0ABS6B9S0_9NOCA|nr:cytochrome c oxidase assembly protein [Nocardia albiluteola]MBU3065924.1 cytochrome c oxidase assembly protein [Nocardia albiluteola]